MMKKKNIAMAMAAVTVASTVAPAFAAEKYNVTASEYSSLEKKIKEMLLVKYTSKADKLEAGKAKQAVFEIKAATTINGEAKEYNVTDAEDLAVVTKLVNKLPKGDQVIFSIKDKGHAKDADGDIVDKGESEYTISAIAKINEAISAKDQLQNDAAKLPGYTVKSKSYNEKDGSLSLTYTKDGKDTVVKLAVGTKVVDFGNADAKKVFVNGEDLTKGLKAKVDVLKPKEYQVAVTNTKIEKINVDETNAQKIAEELISKYVFANLNKAENEIVKDGDAFKVTLNATDIKLSNTKAADIRLSSARVAEDELTPNGTIAQIVLKANKKADLVNILKIMLNGTGFKTIEGAERIDTAIKLSKDRFDASDDAKTAKSVVLVGEYAIADGLASAPLAAEKKAPILLTKKDSLTKEVKEEIVRSMKLGNTVSANKDKTIYIAGGKEVISANVESELVALGVNVKRLEGADRYETSLKVAGELTKNKKAYVVDGYALADAMSIAPVAANEQNPIIVVNGKGLSDNAKTYLSKANEADVIGGKTVISEETLEAVNKLTGDAERVAGLDRQETNAKVIAQYFGAGKISAKDMYVAKDGYVKNDQLVDALAAAPAGKAIVLATNSLTTDQALAVQKATNGVAGKTLTQVGGGVLDAVVTQLKKVLGL